MEEHRIDSFALQALKKWESKALHFSFELFKIFGSLAPESLQCQPMDFLHLIACDFVALSLCRIVHKHQGLSCTFIQSGRLRLLRSLVGRQKISPRYALSMLLLLLLLGLLRHPSHVLRNWRGLHRVLQLRRESRREQLARLTLLTLLGALSLHELGHIVHLRHAHVVPAYLHPVGLCLSTIRYLFHGLLHLSFVNLL